MEDPARTGSHFAGNRLYMVMKLLMVAYSIVDFLTLE